MPMERTRNGIGAVTTRRNNHTVRQIFSGSSTYPQAVQRIHPQPYATVYHERELKAFPTAEFEVGEDLPRGYALI